MTSTGSRSPRPPRSISSSRPRAATCAIRSSRRTSPARSPDCVRWWRTVRAARPGRCRASIRSSSSTATSITVTGGKWTTYRRMAVDALEQAARGPDDRGPHDRARCVSMSTRRSKRRAAPRRAPGSADQRCCAIVIWRAARAGAHAAATWSTAGCGSGCSTGAAAAALAAVLKYGRKKGRCKQRPLILRRRPVRTGDGYQSRSGPVDDLRAPRAASTAGRRC